MAYIIYLKVSYALSCYQIFGFTFEQKNSSYANEMFAILKCMYVCVCV